MDHRLWSSSSNLNGCVHGPSKPQSRVFSLAVNRRPPVLRWRRQSLGMPKFPRPEDAAEAHKPRRDFDRAVHRTIYKTLAKPNNQRKLSITSKMPDLTPRNTKVKFASSRSKAAQINATWGEIGPPPTQAFGQLGTERSLQQHPQLRQGQFPLVFLRPDCNW